MSTVSEITQKVIRRLSQVNGTAVQVYAQDRIVDLIQSAFVFCRGHTNWPDMMTWAQYALDGSTGKIVGGIPNILSWRDLRQVRIDDIHRLFLLPTTINPYTLTGTTPRFIELLAPVDDAPVAGLRKPFRIWPLASVGTVTVQYMRNIVYSTATMDTEVWFDEEAIILHVCAAYSAMDSASASEQALFQGQFDTRMRQLAGDNSNLPRAQNISQYSPSTSEWFER